MWAPWKPEPDVPGGKWSVSCRTPGGCVSHVTTRLCYALFQKFQKETIPLHHWYRPLSLFLRRSSHYTLLQVQGCGSVCIQLKGLWIGYVICKARGGGDMFSCSLSSLAWLHKSLLAWFHRFVRGSAKTQRGIGFQYDLSVALSVNGVVNRCVFPNL